MFELLKKFFYYAFQWSEIFFIFHLLTLNSSGVYQHNTQARSSDCHLSAWTTSGLGT